MFPLIPADSHFAVIAALLAIALFGFWAERQSWGKLVTGAVWTLLLAIAASNLGIIPQSAPAYDFVFQYLVPALIPLFLMDADVRRIIKYSGRVGIAFILACLGTAAGALAGVSLLDLGAREGDLAGIFTATYVGGSVNYAALIQATGFSDASVISAATAVDSLASALFLACLALMPASKWLMSKYAMRDHSAAAINTAGHTGTEASANPTSSSALSMCGALFFSLSVVALADASVIGLNSLNEGRDFGWMRYIFITAYAVIPATLSPKTMKQLKGGQEIGLILAFIFFAAICAGADIGMLIGTAPILLVFVVIILLVHASVVFAGGYAWNRLVGLVSKREDNPATLSLAELIVASNAAILGATTAPALAMARGWPALVTPGILVGVAGYIVGTPLGLLIASYWIA